MPVFSLGDMKNGWSRSDGFSSSQTLSSFCHSVNRPSMRFASLMISAKGRRLLEDALAWAAAPDFGAEALAAGAGAVSASPLASAADGFEAEAGAVAHPPSKAISNGEATRVRTRERDECKNFIGRPQKVRATEASFVPPPLRAFQARVSDQIL